MGDRANFGIRQNDGNTIFVYGHCAGEGMLANFANALERGTDAGRIPGDPAYGTRIIISQLVGPGWQTDLNWGITINTFNDNEHKIPVYDFATDTVSLYNETPYIRGQAPALGDRIVEFSRENFIRKYAKTTVGV